MVTPAAWIRARVAYWLSGEGACFICGKKLSRGEGYGRGDARTCSTTCYEERVSRTAW